MYEGIAAVYDDVVGEPVHVGWAAYAVDAWSVDPQPVRTVLDVCCGTGRMSEEFVARGYRTTGVDGSEAMLVEARALLGPDVPLHHSVLPELAVDGVFDAAVCTFDSLNYLTPTDLVRALSAVAARLRPGGWFVFDLHTETMMRTVATAPRSEARSGSIDLVMSSEVDLAARTCLTRVEVTPDSGLPFTETHVQYFFSDDEIRAALEAAGLTVVRVTDDYGPDPVDPGTLRSSWVARAATG